MGTAALIREIWGEDDPRKPRQTPLDELIAEVYGDRSSGPESPQDAPGGTISARSTTDTGYRPAATRPAGPIPIGEPPLTEGQRQTARTMFDPQFQVDQDTAMEVRATAKEGVEETPGQYAAGKARRVAGQVAGFAGDVAGAAAGGFAATGELGAGLLLGRSPDEIVRRQIEANRSVSEPIAQFTQEVAGEPVGAIEKAARYVPDVAVAGAIALPRAGLRAAGRSVARNVLPSEPRLPREILNQIPEGTPNEVIRKIADDYNASRGLPPIRRFAPVKHDERLSREVAGWYEQAPDAPADPEVMAAYEAFNRETAEQYDELVRQGWEFTGTEDAVLDAYPGAAEMRFDAANKKLRVFTGGEPNRLMTPEQNFKFRAVHDVMAHTSEGYDFHPDGEWNAALKHSQMYSPQAQRALFTETVGQNANLNYGPNGDFNRANPGKEIFPPQKATLLPQEFSHRLVAGIGGDEGIPLVDAPAPKTPSKFTNRGALGDQPPSDMDPVTGKWKTPQKERAAQRDDPIIAAAVRAENGEIFTGLTHGEALNKMEAAGHRATSLHADTSKDLFVTRSGQMITRDELKAEWGGRRPVAELMRFDEQTPSKFTNRRGALGDQPGKRKVGAAAIRVHVPGEPEPRTYTGQVHPLARADAEEELGEALYEMTVEDGFLDEAGNWMTRNEAYPVARKAGQLNPANPKSLDRMRRTKNLYAEGLKRERMIEGEEWTGDVIPDQDRLVDEIKKRFALREAEAAARQAKKRGKTNRRGALGVTGEFDPTDIKDVTEVAAARMFRGVTGEELRGELVALAGRWVTPHLDAIEQAATKIHSRMLQKATKGRGGFPTVKELDQLFKEGMPGMDFYEGIAKGMKRTFGPEDGPFVGKLIAATSPATNATDGSNVRTALKGYKQIKMAGDVKRESFMSTHYSMLKRLIETGKVQAKKGLKVLSFGKNLSLPASKDQAVTVDRWMGRIFFGSDKPTNAQYVFIQEVIRDQAKKWGVSPRQYQAALWHAVRTKTEARYKTGEGATYVDQVVRMIGEGYLDDLLEAVDQPYIAKVRARVQKGVGNRRGNVGIELAAGIAGSGAGAAAGIASGDTPEEKVEQGAIGAALGTSAGLVGAVLGRRAFNAAQAVRAGGQIDEALQFAQKRLNAGRATGRADEYANLGKFALDPTGEKILREEVEKIGPASIGDPKDVVTWGDTRKAAEAIGLFDIAKKDLDQRLSGAEMLAIRNIVNRNVEQLKPLYERLAKGPDPEAEQLMAAIEQQNEALLSRFITNRARTGRDLNNLKILATRINDPFFWRMKAENIAQQGGRSLTGDELRKIDILVEAGDPKALIKHIMDLRPTTVSQQLVTIWKAGLLTNPATHLANITGNTAMAGLEAVKDVPAALADRIFGFFTGQKTKSPNFLRGMAASAKGSVKGYREARNIARGLPSDRALTKVEVPQQTNINLPGLPKGANRLIDTYTKTIFAGRELPVGFIPGLGAQDAFFKELAAARSLDEQARLLGGKDKALVKSLLENPTDEMALNAIVDAEYTTFTRQSRATQAIGNLREAGGAAGHLIAPFTRTPTNIAGTVIDYSPLGFIGAAKHTIKLYRAAKRGASAREIRDLQRLASNKFGRAAVGLVPIYVGWKLAENDAATGARPGQRTEAQQSDLEGRQENSVQVGDNWRSVARLSPLGNLIALGANAYHIWNNPELDPLERGGGAVASIGTTLMESPFLQGVDEISRMARDPVGGMGDFAGNLVGSAVPSVVRATARGMDPVIRETEPTEPVEHTPAGIARHAGRAALNRIQAGIPGATQSLPAKRDQFGREKTRTGGLYSQLFDFTRPRADQRTDDPVLAEMSRVGAAVGQLQRLTGEPIQDYQARQEEVGALLYEALAKTMFDTRYRSMSPVEQKDALEKAARGVRAKHGRGQ